MLVIPSQPPRPPLLFLTENYDPDLKLDPSTFIPLVHGVEKSVALMTLKFTVAI